MGLHVECADPCEHVCKTYCWEGKGYGKGKKSENEDDIGRIDTPPDLPYMVFQLEQEKRELKLYVQMLEKQVVRLRNVAHLLINNDVVHRR